MSRLVGILILLIGTGCGGGDTETADNPPTESDVEEAEAAEDPESGEVLADESEDEGEETFEELLESPATESGPARHIAMILIGYDDGATAERNLDAARALAAQIHARAATEDFADLAREASDDPAKENGGDLGQIERQLMVEALDNAAFSLEVGQISAPIQTERGFHILKRLAD